MNSIQLFFSFFFSSFCEFLFIFTLLKIDAERERNGIFSSSSSDNIKILNNIVAGLQFWHLKEEEKTMLFFFFFSYLFNLFVKVHYSETTSI